MQEYEVKDAKEAADQAKAERLAEAKSEHEKLLAERKLLPIYPYREELLDAVAAYQIVVIVGETGSGKTTQVSPSSRPWAYDMDAVKPWIDCLSWFRTAATTEPYYL